MSGYLLIKDTRYSPSRPTSQAGHPFPPQSCCHLLKPGANFGELRQCEVPRIPIPRTRVNKGRKRGLGLLGAPAHRSRIGYFRLATLLRLGQLVPDVVLNSFGARCPLLLGGSLLAGGSPASALPSGLGQLVPDVVLGPPGAQSMVKFCHTALPSCSGAQRPVVKHPYSGSGFLSLYSQSRIGCESCYYPQALHLHAIRATNLPIHNV